MEGLASNQRGCLVDELADNLALVKRVGCVAQLHAIPVPLALKTCLMA